MNNVPTTFAERAWYAMHCLPRTPRGRPPSMRKIELQNKLPLAVLSKLFAGQRHYVEAATKQAMALAFQVPVEWLASGAGEAPRPTGDVPPFPGAAAAVRGAQQVPPAAHPQASTPERAAVVAFIRGAASMSASRDELLMLAARIAAGDHVGD